MYNLKMEIEYQEEPRTRKNNNKNGFFYTDLCILLRVLDIQVINSLMTSLVDANLIISELSLVKECSLEVKWMTCKLLSKHVGQVT